MDKIPKSDRAKLGLAIALLGIAAFFFYRFYQNQQEREPQVFFYDLSEGQLFVSAQSAVPPIVGLNDGEEDGVRAIVISADGKCSEEGRQVAYLEKYSPELKRQFESFRQRDVDGTPPVQTLSRSESKAHHFVKRVKDSKWHPINSPQGIGITEGWRVPGPGGQVPVVCVP